MSGPQEEPLWSVKFRPVWEAKLSHIDSNKKKAPDSDRFNSDVCSKSPAINERI